MNATATNPINSAVAHHNSSYLHVYQRQDFKNRRSSSEPPVQDSSSVNASVNRNALLNLNTCFNRDAVECDDGQSKDSMFIECLQNISTTVEVRIHLSGTAFISFSFLFLFNFLYFSLTSNDFFFFFQKQKLFCVFSFSVTVGFYGSKCCMGCRCKGY